MTAFADSKLQTFIHSDRVNEFADDLDVVARFYHLNVRFEFDRSGDIRRAEIELRAIAGEERFFAAAFGFRKNVDLRFEFRVRVDGARLCENLTAVRT